MAGDSKRVGHPARDRAGQLRCRQAIARPVYADDAKPCGFRTRSQVRRLHSATRTTVAPQHRGSRRTAVVDKSHGTAAGQQNRLILHTLLPSIRRVQIAQFGTQSRQSSRRPSCRPDRRIRRDGSGVGRLRNVPGPWYGCWAVWLDRVGCRLGRIIVSRAWCSVRVTGVQVRAFSSSERCRTIQAADRARQVMAHSASQSPVCGVTPAWMASAALSRMA